VIQQLWWSILNEILAIGYLVRRILCNSMDSDNPIHKGFLIYTTSIVHTSIIDYPHIPSQGTFEDDIQFPKVGCVIVPWRVHVNVFFLDPHVL